MFKKRERKSQNQSTRRRRDEDDDNDNSGIDQSGSSENPNEELQSILAKTKERRTLIHQLQYKRGVDAHELLQQGNQTSSSMGDLNSDDVTGGGGTNVARNNSNVSTRVDALSSKTQLPTGGTIVAEEQRIWDQKHAAAMEEYVQQKLMQTSSNSVVTATATETEEKLPSDQHTTTMKSLATTKEQLYRDLAAQAAKLSGKSSDIGTTNDPNGTSTQRHDDSSSGDVLTAGAATAIMEVILPMDDRIQAVAATARAAAAANTNSVQPPQSLPYVRNKSSAVPNRFRSSYNHHHPMVHQNSNANGVKKRPYDNNDATTESTSSAIDQDRPGFAAARQLQQQQQHRSFPTSTSGVNKNSSNHHQSRSTDDRVYQQFIKRQREQHGR